MIVLVPTLELGAQIAMLVYKLFGGSVNSGIPGAAGNMYAYTGPRGLKVFLLSINESAVQAKWVVLPDICSIIKLQKAQAVQRHCL